MDGLDAEALPLARDPRSGTSAAVLGFPHNGPYDVRAARLGETRTTVTQDAYGRGPVQRLIVSLRGVVRSGNSGGPMVDGARPRRDDDLRRHDERPAGRLRRPELGRQTGPRGRARGGLHRSLRPLRRPLVCDQWPRRSSSPRSPPWGATSRACSPAPSPSTRATSSPTSHVVTWAVGHLVQLAEPDEYDPKYKKWRMADLPIVPDEFRLVVRDERSRKQMTVITKELGRKDVDTVVNACDAGREGELIFAWLYEKASAKKPVQRLWLSSMTKAAIKQAFSDLRPGEEFGRLEEAARSRSEADWIVGMNATRAATIRLRSSFDGAVSLGRVQTPTLAILARREVEIREFKPEKYWLVDAKFEPQAGEQGRAYEGRFHAGAKPRLASAAEAEAIVAAVQGQAGEITKLETTTKKERAPLLYDLTTLQREANNRYGFSARRTLAAAQRLYEEHKALTYPRTNSRFLSTDMIGEIKPTAAGVGANREYAKPAAYVTGLDVLPLGRVVNDAKVTDHHAIIPTRSEHRVEKMSDDDKKVYDMVVRRFLAVFHPDAVWENTRLETTVAEHVFRTRGRVLLEPGWRVGLRRGRGRQRVARRTRTTRAPTRRCPSSSATSASTRARSPPPRRRPSRRGATPTRRCSARWRRPARSSTTRSCASR